MSKEPKLPPMPSIKPPRGRYQWRLTEIKIITDYANAYALAAIELNRTQNAWHDAVLNECMKIEAAYVEADPVKTVKNLIDWHVLHEHDLAQQQEGEAASHDGEVVAATGSPNDTAMIKWVSEYRPKIGDKIYAGKPSAPQAPQAAPLEQNPAQAQQDYLNHLQRCSDDVAKWPAWKTAPQAAPAVPTNATGEKDYEHRHAVMQGECIAACDEYFEARPQIDNGDRRRIFEAGFERGYKQGAAMRRSETPITASKDNRDIAADILSEVAEALRNDTLYSVKLLQSKPAGGRDD